MEKTKDPCQRQACAIQECLKKNNFQEEKCQHIIQLMIDCCNSKDNKSSKICHGMRSYSVTNTSQMKE